MKTLYFDLWPDVELTRDLDLEALSMHWCASTKALEHFLASLATMISLGVPPPANGVWPMPPVDTEFK